MDIRAELLKGSSKEGVVKIASYIVESPEKFDFLMELLFSGDDKISSRAAWVASYCAEKNPELINPYLAKLVDNLKRPVQDAVKRSTMRILASVEIPLSLYDDLVNIAFEYMTDLKMPVAVKVFAMTVLDKMCVQYPDLLPELKLIIEDQLPHASPGFISRAKKIMK